MAQELKILTDRVLETARKAAEEEVARGREEAEHFAVEYRQETLVKVNARREEYRRRGQVEADRLIREAEMESKLRLLQTKQELIHHAFAQALPALSGLPAGEKIALYQDLLLSVVEDGRETIAVSVGERGLWTKVVFQVNQELARKGRRGEIKLRNEPAEIKGGFLLYSATYEVNAALESIIADLEERYFQEVAGILFS
jgi:vacuolar-type H+-ATPase subunit E/Vma4